MYSFLRKNHRYLFFAAWLVVNLFQACSTELLDDEAYYWVYSQYPAWGYFDHPPMIAMMINAGYSIFKSELGVRLLVVLANAATIFLISRLIDNRSDKLFYAIALSVVVGHVGGIIAVPDVPLLFFVTLFFLVYKRFLNNMTLLNCAMLGISTALMLYTKYHGVLVVIFTLLSNPKLFTRSGTYVVGIISLVLFTPHLYWQYMHGFPSVKFHLFERNAPSYNIQYTSEYLLAQLALAGPFVGWLFIWSSLRYRTRSALEKALKYTIAGFYVFFLISTLKGRVEANWTLPAFVALIVLSHQYLRDKPQAAKWVYRTLPLSLLLMLLMRVYMVSDIDGLAKIGKDEFHRNMEWTSAIARKADGRPVVFVDSYQRPSKYWFYQRDPALGLNTPDYRRNNYNFWTVEENFIGKPVLVVGDDDNPVLTDKIQAPGFKRKASAVFPNYFSFMKVQFNRISNTSTSDKVVSSFAVIVPEKYLQYFQTAPFDTASIQLAILDFGDSIRYFSSSTKVKQIVERNALLTVEFPVRLPKGRYDARLGISSAVPGEPTLNSTSFRVYIE